MKRNYSWSIVASSPDGSRVPFNIVCPSSGCFRQSWYETQLGATRALEHCFFVLVNHGYFNISWDLFSRDGVIDSDFYVGPVFDD